MKTLPLLLAAMAAVALAKAPKKPVHPVQTPLDRYVNDARARSADAAAAAPGSIWSAGSRMADAARDLRASQLDDMITILVVENASARIQLHDVAGLSVQPVEISISVEGQTRGPPDADRLQGVAIQDPLGS